MSFKSLVLQQKNDIGTELHFDNFLIFFGNTNAQLNVIKMKYADILFSRTKQTHRTTIVESRLDSDLIAEADAHFSYEENHGLCVISADCMPIFIVSTDQGQPHWAIHAGWRGIAGRIVCKVLSQMNLSSQSAQKLRFFVGPHIQKNSFEVENDVKDQLLASIKNPSERHFKQKNQEKFIVDLYQLFIDQILEFGITADQVFNLSEDTFTNTEYHSYRRDKSNLGRQVSFAAKLR